MRTKTLKFLSSLILAVIFISCDSNDVIYEASPSTKNLKLNVTDAIDFKTNHKNINDYLTSSEAYNATAVQYRLGSTIGFKELYFIKPMMKNFKAEEGMRTVLTLRSYNHSNALIDELVLSRTDNDTIFSGKVFKDLTIEKMVNQNKTRYSIDSKGKFQIIK
ncbi:hypothetical protein BST92_02505 [Nonlabens arenilitoris]|uniref:Uncharacterized protein n=1 Tax=Nonlabens arenilitoris TaxID=1217969 RepID=A0A2S7U8E7_9FLAO|nr:hypothetical protein [Nonlabens arenilitoris]PQJ30870.1 hypothetical protein BST92_02505 [Nonlabens arenilitoris]